MRIGFIGTGNIGTPMAASILKAGFELVVNDIHREKTLPLVDQGAVWADYPAEVAAQCDIICTCLPGPAEMEPVTLGPSGILEGARSGSVYIDHTTNSPFWPGGYMEFSQRKGSPCSTRRSAAASRERKCATSW